MHPRGAHNKTLISNTAIIIYKHLPSIKCCQTFLSVMATVHPTHISFGNTLLPIGNLGNRQLARQDRVHLYEWEYHSLGKRGYILFLRTCVNIYYIFMGYRQERSPKCRLLRTYSQPSRKKRKNRDFIAYKKGAVFNHALFT